MGSNIIFKVLRRIVTSIGIHRGMHSDSEVASVHSSIVTKAAPQETSCGSKLEVGMRMRCIGLVNSRELNGSHCTLMHFNPETGRWTVELESDGSACNLKPENLERLAASSQADDARSQLAPDAHVASSGPICTFTCTSSMFSFLHFDTKHAKRIVTYIADMMQVPPVVILIAGAVFAFSFLLYGFCGQLICNIVAFGYPAFESFTCLQQRVAIQPHMASNTLEIWSQYWAIDKKMEFLLQYWIVFAMFALLESFTYYAVVWIPFYYPSKLSFFLWLCSPPTQGAKYVYEWVVLPLLNSRRHLIDSALAVTASEAKDVLRSAAMAGGALNAGANMDNIGAALDVVEDQQTRPPKRARTNGQSHSH